MVYDARRNVCVLHGGESSRVTFEYDGTAWRRHTPNYEELSSSGFEILTKRAPHVNHGVAFDESRGVTVVVGDGVPGGEVIEGTWEYDGHRWRLRSIVGPPVLDTSQSRYRRRMCYDAAREVCVLHSFDTQGQTRAETWEWSGADWTQRDVDNGPRFDRFDMAYDRARGVSVLHGGPNAETWQWDGAAWTLLAEAGPSVSAGYSLSYDWDNDRIVLLISASGPKTWGWDGAAWSVLADAGVQLLEGFCTTYDVARGVVIAHGKIQRTRTYEFDGAVWTRRFPEPEARIGHALAYDSDRGVTVLFGGQGNPIEVPPHTWEWDGAFWSRTETTGPPGQSGHAMAYDASRRVTVLVGRGETWEYDPADGWSLRSQTGPPQMTGHTMAYDPQEQAILLYGSSRQTWKWDGKDWILRASNGPSGSNFSMAFNGSDPEKGWMAMENRLDLWRWDGEDWNLVGDIPSSAELFFDPTTRQLAACVGGRINRYLEGQWEYQFLLYWPALLHGRRAVMDTQRGALVLFGGGDQQNQLEETWELRRIAPRSDIDGDGSVGLTDLAQLLSDYGDASGTHALGDLNRDGDVDMDDLAELLEAFGSVCP